ncbi:MAG: hypothetical protein ABSH41_07325 [Syntrophobacteraceae bacterium]|jgi:hypothetical protein
MDSKDKNPKKYGSAVFHGGVLRAKEDGIDVIEPPDQRNIEAA